MAQNSFSHTFTDDDGQIAAILRFRLKSEDSNSLWYQWKLEDSHRRALTDIAMGHVDASASDPQRKLVDSVARGLDLEASGAKPQELFNDVGIAWAYSHSDLFSQTEPTIEITPSAPNPAGLGH